MNKLLQERAETTKYFNNLEKNLASVETKAGELYSNYTTNSLINVNERKKCQRRLNVCSFIADEMANEMERICSREDAKLLFYLGSVKQSSCDTPVEDDYYYNYITNNTFSCYRPTAMKRTTKQNEINISDILSTGEHKPEAGITIPEIGPKIFCINLIIESLIEKKDYQTWEDLREDLNIVTCMIRNGKSIDAFISTDNKTR